MCMLVMEELQKTYSVASIYRGIFTKALEQIFPGYSVPPTLSSSTANTAAVPEIRSQPHDTVTEAETSGLNTQFNGFDSGVADDGYLMSTLMDEASIFKFWETWNQI